MSFTFDEDIDFEQLREEVPQNPPPAQNPLPLPSSSHHTSPSPSPSPFPPHVPSPTPTQSYQRQKDEEEDLQFEFQETNFFNPTWSEDTSTLPSPTPSPSLAPATYVVPIHDPPPPPVSSPPVSSPPVSSPPPSSDMFDSSWVGEGEGNVTEINMDATTAVQTEQEDTLDEPVTTTIWRELRGVGIKMFHVIAPRGKGPQALRDWDLWGPLVLCFLLEAFLTFGDHQLATENDTEHTLIFTIVWIIIWAGSVFITINSTLLGGNLSFFQSVSLIGYCLFPLVLASFVCTFWSNFWFRFGMVLVGVLWSSGAALGFLTASVPEARRFLALYPVVLFYICLGWVIFWVMQGNSISLVDNGSKSTNH